MTAQNYVRVAFVSAAVLSAANKPRRLALSVIISRFDKIIFIHIIYLLYFTIFIIYLLNSTSIFSMPISAKSRPVRTGSAYKPVRADFASDAYTLANETADGTT